MLLAVLLFVVASLAEIGGGYLVWLWLRRIAPAVAWIGGLRHYMGAKALIKPIS